MQHLVMVLATMDDPGNTRSRHLDHIYRGGCTDQQRQPGYGHCAHLPAPSAGSVAASPGAGRPCSQSAALGIGPSHAPIIEGVYGLPMTTPLEHLREYVSVLRAALWEGKVDHHGRFYTIKTTLPRTPRTPILISALREGAFRLAGEVADGAISWVCPVLYLLEKALPALRSGAAKSGRPVPPLVAHIPVALGHDRQTVLAAARKQLGRYRRLPFYANMFADAGFPVSLDGTMSDALIDSLVVSGNEAAITERLVGLLAAGLDELLVMPIGVADPAGEQARLARLIGQL